jgi:hypothetical protein
MIHEFFFIDFFSILSTSDYIVMSDMLTSSVLLRYCMVWALLYDMEWVIQYHISLQPVYILMLGSSVDQICMCIA